MREKKQSLSLLALLLALLLIPGILAGCGKDPDTPTQPVDDQATEPEETKVDVAAERSESFGLCYQPDAGLNPYTCTRLANRPVMSLLYQGLFSVTSEYEAVPQLCKTYSHSDDLETWVFTLEDARFSDGNSLTAKDVVASLEASRSSPVYGDRLRHVERIVATGPREVAIILDTAYERLPLLLDIPIVRAMDVTSATPLGTGAYVIQDLGGTCLVRKQNWWSDQYPAVDYSTIRLTAAATPSDIRDEFEFGRTDLVCSDPDASSYVQYRCDYELWDCSTGLMLYVGCNLDEDHLFQNTTLRSALTYAMDRVALAELYGSFARPATLPADPNSFCYDPVLAQDYAYDPARFRKAVEDSGLGYKPMTLLVNSDDAIRLEAAKLVVRSLSDSGMNVQLDPRPYAEYRAALRNSEFDLYLGEVKLSPNFDLSTFFRYNGSLDYAGMVSSEFNSLVTMALENSGNYYDLFRAVMNDGRLCPLLFRTYAVYTTRGTTPELNPGIDSVFLSPNTRSLEEAWTQWVEPVIPEPTEPTEAP